MALAATGAPAQSKNWLSEKRPKIEQPLGEVTTAVAAKPAGPEIDAHLGDRVYQKAMWAMEHANHVRFQHNNKAAADQVAERLNGDVFVETDCSGFASWLLYSISPDRLWAVEALKPGHECPEPKTFARFFASLPMDKPLNGWIGLNDVLALKRGDFIAWGPAQGKHGGEGHVAIVTQTPAPAQTIQLDGKTVKVINVQVVDSSSAGHFPPETLPAVAEQTRRDGLGVGYVRLVLNDEGKPVAHWEGSADGEGQSSQPTASPIISFGRLVGAQHFPNLKSKDLSYERFSRRGMLTSF